jgi:translocation and assembly module TamB
MSRAARIVTIVSGSILTIVMIVLLAVVVIVRTDWFQHFVRGKIISSVEDSTGGKVDLRSFTFDASRLTATATGFVIHGTESPGTDPLFQASQIVLTINLLSSLKKPFILEYLSVEHPSANIVVLPDGHTNIPEPKRSISSKSALQTVVDLAIRKIQINRGVLHFGDQSMPVDIRGNNLRVQLSYNSTSDHYQGGLALEPLVANSPGRPPLEAKIDVPVDLAGDAIQITNARITTPQSAIYANASIHHMASPQISAQVVAHIALDEISRSVDLAIHPKPGLNTLEATVSVAANGSSMQIQNALATLGHTGLAASGDLRKGAEIQGTLVLDELTSLLALPQCPSGTVQIAGNARVPENGPFELSGTISSRDASYQRFRNMRVASGFRVDPKAVTVTGLTLNWLGGELRADGRLENFGRLHATGSLRNFTIQNLTAALMNRPIGYAGAIGGTVEADGDLKGALRGAANLTITPAGAGVPVSGNLNASYDSAQNLISLNHSRIALPNTRLDLTGAIGRTADIRLESRNLDDFAPVVNVGSTIRLKGGTGSIVAHESGPFNAAQISGHVQLTAFTLENRPFEQLSADLQASPWNAAVANGVLKRNGSLTQFSGSIGLNNWKPADAAPVSASLTSNNDIADLLALAGTEAQITGPLNANVAISGTLANPRGYAQVTAGPGTAYEEPYDHVEAIVNLSDQRVDLKTLEVRAGSADLQAQGSFIHPRDSFSTGHIQVHAATNQVQLSQFKRVGISGTAEFNSDILGELRNAQFVPSAINAKLAAATDRYGNLNVTATTYGSDLNTRVDSNIGGSTTQITARTELKNGYPTVADAIIRSLQVEKVYDQAKGTLSAQAHFNGTMDDPRADLTFDLTNASIFGEPLTKADGKASYANKTAALSSLNVVSPAGSIALRGSYARDTGGIDVHLDAPSLQLQRIQNLAKSKTGLSGVGRLIADVSAEVHGREILPTKAEVTGGVDNFALNNQKLGHLSFEGHTSSDVLSLKLDADLAGSQIRGNGQAQLRGDYNGSAQVTLANVKYSALKPLLASDEPFEGLVEATANFSGPFRRPQDGSGNVQLTKLEVSSIENPVTIRNDGPIALRFDHSSVQIENARLTGPSTNLEIAGKASLAGAKSLDLVVNASTDLAVLKRFSPSTYSAGNASANATIHGTFSNPQLNGRIDLKNASIQMADWPNGISNANGTILLNGRNARIASLTAETGGGKVTLDGSAGYSGSVVNFDLRANAQNVRTRYVGASITANAALTLSGTSQRGLLGGTVTITRVGYNSNSDIGAILTGVTTPPTPPSGPGFASQTRVHIRVLTSPGVRFQTSLTEQLSASADLTILGNLQSPGIVGRVNVSSGTLIFFGNKYSVNRGTISFYSATSIQPILDIDLETAAQGVTVDLGVTGPIDNLKLSYRSDPPLKFEDIVALLATGKTPSDPTIAVNQPAPPDQTAMQMGESAIVGQAIANPVADRLQRVFGVTQLKVSPQFVAGTTLPQARITVQQQVNSTITFTYSQDVSQPNSLLVRVEMQMTPRFSAVATRDENGIFGLDFYYKKQFR